MADDIDKITRDYEKSLEALKRANERTLKIQDREYKERVKAVRDRFADRKSEIRDKYKEGEARKKLLGLLKDEEDAFEKRLRLEEKVQEQTKKLTDSFVGLGKAAYAGTGAFTDFTKNVYGLGTIGRVFDTNVETFRQLSMVGGNFGKSIVDLRLAARDAALPLDDFAKLIGSNSEALAAMFGSTTQGAKAIANLGRQTRELGIDRLAPLGFTVDEINETLLLNLDSQRRTGILNTLTDQQRINSAIKFAEELDRLAKLTGQQRDELRKQIEQQQANERFQAFLQGATDETRKRLQAFAGTVAGISPDLAEGFQDLIANAGVPVTESALALVQNIPGARDVVNDLISGVVTSEQALVKIRDLSSGSVNRFRKATVTGQVEFLRLQGGIINLGNRITDTGAVLNEQNKSATSLVQNLTTFEQATKVLSSQFQSIETGLLQAFGPALGGFMGMVQGVFGAGGAVATMLAKAPAATATILASVLAGKYLFGKAAQIGIIAAGTSIGMRGLGGTLGKLGIGGKGTMGKLGTAAKFGAGRVIPGVGAALGVGSSLSMMASDDKDVQRQGKFGLGGAAAGALAGAAIGSIIPGLGTVVGGLIGAGLGSMAGQYAGAKQFGGGMDGGKPYLVGENGPEIVSTKSNSVVSANRDLESTFDTKALEHKMTSMVTELNAANKTLTSMVNGVNTLVAVESRALKAVETSARKDMNQVGMV